MSGWAKAPESRDQIVLFPTRLDDVVPQDHCVRLLDEILERLDWSAWEAKYHLQFGQPPIHPRVVAGVLLYGLLTRIRSSRALENAVQERIDFRWLVEGRSLDHTTISKFRRAHSAELGRSFVAICRTARELGLVTLERLGYDGTRVRANNRRTGTRTPDELRKERDELAAKFADYERQAREQDARDEEAFSLHGPLELPAELRNKGPRLEKLNQVLAKMEQSKHAGRKSPKRIPRTDLDARVMPNKDGGCAPNYTPVATVDIAGGLIVHADVLNEVNEDGYLLKAVDEVVGEFDLTESPPDVLADGLIGTGANLAGCAERGIDLYSPSGMPDPAANPCLRDDPTQPVSPQVMDRIPMHTVKAGQPRQIDKSAFLYDEQRNCYWCPQGKPLTSKGTTSEATASGRRIRERFRADPEACAGCPLRDRCLTGKTKAREINREQYETQRTTHAEKMATPEAQAIYKERRHAGERPFATIKQMFGLRQFLLRGLVNVTTEWLWAVLAFNLHRLMSFLRTRAGPPRGLLAAA